MSSSSQINCGVLPSPFNNCLITEFYNTMQGYGDLPGQPSGYKDVMAEMDPLDVDGLLSKCNCPAKIFKFKSRRKWAVYLEVNGL